MHGSVKSWNAGTMASFERGSCNASPFLACKVQTGVQNFSRLWGQVDFHPVLGRAGTAWPLMAPLFPPRCFFAPSLSFPNSYLLEEILPPHEMESSHGYSTTSPDGNDT